MTSLNTEYLFYLIYTFLNDYLRISGVLGIVQSILDFLRPISVVVSLLLIIGIVYSIIRINQIQTEQDEKLSSAVAEASGQKGETLVKNPKWERVLKHINSDNSAEWRLAIVEADILLEEMLDILGHRGVTVGDKLKTVERSDFTSIDDAWEAHKVRNQIAHEGGEFMLNERTAKMTIDRYKKVFDEFRFI